jgi:SAM-dependent methyltransferase
MKRIVRSDVNQSIPFRTNSFSLVTCLDVMEHLKSDEGLLDEMIRICKPGGHIIITVPAYACLWSPHDDALQHLRRYTRRQLLNHARKRDCRVVKATYFNTTLFPPIFVARKFQSWFSRKGELQSDLFLPLPNWANKALTAVYLFELCCLRFFAFPLGVSLLMILQKDKNDRTGKGKN